MTNSDYKIAVLVSGRGSNLDTLINAQKQGNLGASIAVVVSDQPQARALELAKNNKIPTAVVQRRPQELNGEQFNNELILSIRPFSPNLIVLAGFMRIIRGNFISAFHGQVINIHPSLLPSFRGLHAQKQALDSGVKFAGCTVHFVEEELDSGPIIAQAVVHVDPFDTEESLSRRILKCEHKILPAVVNAFALNNKSIASEKTDKKLSLLEKQLTKEQNNTALFSIPVIDSNSKIN